MGRRWGGPTCPTGFRRCRRHALPVGLNRFQLVTLVLGAGASIGVEVWTLVRFALEFPVELYYEVGPAIVGSLLLYSPYVGLALLGRRVRPVIGYGALGILLIVSGLFYVIAASSSTGALIVFSTLPFQWLVAALAGIRRFRRCVAE